MPIERFPSVPAKSEITLTARNEPRPPRFLFFDNNHLVQLQSDWYAYNWRKTPFKPDYERYESGRSRFKTYLAKLRTFLREELSAEFQPKQGEVTYVNHIPVSSLEGDPGPLGMLLNDVQPRAGQYLPEPRYANASWGYDIRNSTKYAAVSTSFKYAPRLTSKSGHATRNTKFDPAPRVANLHLAISTGVLKLPRSRGREWIVRGFQDVTTSSNTRDVGVIDKREALT